MTKATLVVHVLTFFVLIWIGLRLEPRPDPSVRTLQRELEVLRNEVVAALADAVPRSQPSRAASAPVTEPASSAAVERTEATDGTAARLAEAVNALTRAAARLGGTLAVPPLHRIPASSDRRALTELHARVDAEDEGVMRTYLFVPLAEVLQRFGQPDAVRMVEGGLWVRYRLEDGEVVFHVHDGLVVRVT